MVARVGGCVNGGVYSGLFLLLPEPPSPQWLEPDRKLPI